MQPLKTIATLLLTMMATAAWAQPKLSFRDGTFKIVQFTDIHWNEHSEHCAENKALFRNIIETEKPDMAVLTGDIVTNAPAEEGWKSIIDIFEQAKLPFVVTLGNHDGEVIGKAEIYKMLTQSGYYAGTKGAENVSGYGNNDIAIFSSQAGNNKPSAMLYFIDSNDYPQNKFYGTYDKIAFDEIQWYRSASRRNTQANGGKPLPSIAFYHIPLLEYNQVAQYEYLLGKNGEGVVSSAKINSGLFSSFIDQQDVMGGFCGHDHENDFIGKLFGIALAYGRASGRDGYGDSEKGARIIKLYEGKRKFDTWVRTASGQGDTFYYPSAISSKNEREMTFLPAINAKAKKQGVAFEYYEGNFKSTNDVQNAKKVNEGTLSNFNIKGAKQEDHFAFVFKSLIKIDQRDVYRFYIYSDDGARLWIDGQPVVDNDGSHNTRRAEGTIALEAGLHSIEVRYFEDYMGQELEVGYYSKNIEETPIPDNILYLPNKK